MKRLSFFCSPLLISPLTSRYSRGLNRSVLILMTLIVFVSMAGVVAADDGEFWDAGVASLLDTKRLHRSYLQLKAGTGVLHDVDSMQVPPADTRFLAEGTFYGIKLDRYERIFAMYANVGLGSHDNGTPWRLDGYRARLSVYNYLKGARLTLGSILCEREKALNEKFVAVVHPFEYAAGGAMKMIVVAVNAKAFGYEFRRYFSADDYHGLRLFQMDMKVGLVLGKQSPIAFETSVNASIGASWYKRKDFSSAFEMALHWNNRVLPMDLSARAEYRYASDDRHKNIETDFHDSYYMASALLGLRY